MSDVDDDLGADIAAAMGGSDVSPAVETVSPAVDTSPVPAEDDGRARDEAGRFKTKDEPVKAPEALKTDAVAAPVTADPTKAPELQKQTVAAPTNWKGGGKIEWGRLPAAVQQELSQDYTRMSQTQAQLDSLNAAIGPQRSQVLAATYGSVEGAIKSLLAMSDMASQDAPGFVRWFCQQRGIPLAQLAGQGQVQGDEPAQQPHPLEEEVRQLRSAVQSFVQQQQQGQQSNALSLVNTFSADPAHPYFNDVYPQVMALLKDVVTEGAPQERLQKAYEMAIWAHPETRQSLIAEERKRLGDEEAARVRQAQNASVSISGSPAGAKVLADEPDDDLEGTIRRQVNAAFS